MLYLFRQWREQKIPSHIIIDSSPSHLNGKWFAVIHGPETWNFRLMYRHRDDSYYRNDGTWGESMLKDNGNLGYFLTRESLVESLINHFNL